MKQTIQQFKSLQSPSNPLTEKKKSLKIAILNVIYWFCLLCMKQTTQQQQQQKPASRHIAIDTTSFFQSEDLQ